MGCGCKKRGGFGSGGGSRRYTAAELERRKTLSTGQCDSLKIDTGTTRVWLSRCTRADGEPYNDKVSVEKLRGGRWVVVDEYQG